MSKTTNNGSGNQDEIKAMQQRIAELEKSLAEEKSEKSSLFEHLQKHRNLFENSRIGMIRTDAETGAVMEANAKAREILNQKYKANINIVNDYLQKEDKQKIIRKLKKQGFIEEEEFQIAVSGGKKKWIAFSSVYYPRENSIETTFRDITEAKETLLELKKVNDELDNFVYHASHDLRSPLRSVLGLLSILKVENDPEQQERCIEMIEGSIHRLDKLVVDLLSISRNNRQPNPMEKVNFMIEINNAIENFYHTANTRRLQIITHISEPVHLVSDAARIRIILNNLISNAIKYRSYQRDYSLVKIYVWVNESQAHLEIEDNGIGIPESKKNRVFDMFYRASQESEGSGLGLYIVKNVIENLNGTIDMDSAPNVGTFFKIKIPNSLGKEKLKQSDFENDAKTDRL